VSGPARRAWALVAGAMLGCASAHAHHSFGMFDKSQCKEMTGTVKAFQFLYPHSWIWLTVPTAAGVETWAFEGTDPASLRARGWSQDSVKPGDKITLEYWPLRDGRKGGSYIQVTQPDGKVLTVFSCGGLPADAPK